MMRGSKLALVAVALCLCQSLIRVEARSQVQAIWQFSGPCFPVSDDTITKMIQNALNPLTNSPWGAAQQSGGFTSLCAKLSIPDCTAANTIRLNTRRLHQSSCSNRWWFLYMDTTEPENQAGWDPLVIMDRVKAITQDGTLLQALGSTGLGADTVSLRLLQTVQLPGSSPPSEATAPSSDSPFWDGSSLAPDSSSSGSGNLAIPDDSSSSGSGSGSSSLSVPASSPPPPVPTPAPSPRTSGSVAVVSAGGGGSSDNGGSGGGKSLSKPVVILIVVASVAAAAVIAGLVGALMLRKRTQAQVQARFQADLDEHRRKRDMRRSMSMSQRSTFGDKVSTSMARRHHELDVPATPPASIAVVAGSPDTLLDSRQARSAQAELPPHEKKRGRFLGMF